MKYLLFLPVVLILLLASCAGRTSDNMTPLGETVDVVIPVQDLPVDSALAD